MTKRLKKDQRISKIASKNMYLKVKNGIKLLQFYNLHWSSNEIYQYIINLKILNADDLKRTN